MIIEGKTFVVTGGASGLGEGTTRECVARPLARSPARPVRSRRCLIMASLRPSPWCRIVARGGNMAIFDLKGERAAGIVAELGDAAAFFECNVMEEESIDAVVAAEPPLADAIAALIPRCMSTDGHVREEQQHPRHARARACRRSGRG